MAPYLGIVFNEHDTETIFVTSNFLAVKVGIIGFHCEEICLGSINFVTRGAKLWVHLHPRLLPHIRAFL